MNTSAAGFSKTKWVCRKCGGHNKLTDSFSYTISYYRLADPYTGLYENTKYHSSIMKRCGDTCRDCLVDYWSVDSKWLKDFSVNVITP